VAANVAANLAVTAWGAAGLYLTAVVLIPFDLTSRDALHELWAGPGLRPKMSALVLTGSVFSAALNADSLPIALASFAAFASAGTSDALVYHALRKRDRLLRMNASNAVSAFVDSSVFVLLAFGFLPSIIITQWALKFFGGLAWSLLLVRAWKPSSPSNLS
jgi:hypothetical protein